MAGSGTMSVDTGVNGDVNTRRRAEKDVGKPERVHGPRAEGRSRPEKAPPKNPPKRKGK